MKDSVFPKDFFWGAGSSAFQVEGDTPPTDWTQAAEEGRVPNIGKACEHYTRFREDFDLAKSLGHNAHRFSIEWARIEPEEGVFDEKEIEHYREVLRALRERGMEPFVTLYHFTLPLWFSESGGWKRKDAPEIFARYCAYVVKHLSGLSRYFYTINEPNNLYNSGYLRGKWPPHKKYNFFGYLSVFLQLTRAHNAAYQKIKQEKNDCYVGIVFYVQVFKAISLFWKVVACILNYVCTYSFMNRVHRYTDMIGVNYYRTTTLGKHKAYIKTDIGWDMQPEELYEALRIMQVYHKPLFVSEAGIADAKDHYRADYIKKSIHAIAYARTNGMDVRGFFYWALLDNYELADGYAMRFGLIAMDYNTQTRTIRPSAYVYKEIIEKNGAMIGV